MRIRKKRSKSRSVATVASLMVDNKVHLVPVVADERMVGVIARLDIIRSMGE